LRVRPCGPLRTSGRESLTVATRSGLLPSLVASVPTSNKKAVSRPPAGKTARPTSCRKPLAGVLPAAPDRLVRSYGRPLAPAGPPRHTRGMGEREDYDDRGPPKPRRPDPVMPVLYGVLAVAVLALAALVAVVVWAIVGLTSGPHN
jgi:hypothetical protein